MSRVYSDREVLPLVADSAAVSGILEVVQEADRECALLIGREAQITALDLVCPPDHLSGRDQELRIIGLGKKCHILSARRTSDGILCWVAWGEFFAYHWLRELRLLAPDYPLTLA